MSANILNSSLAADIGRTMQIALGSVRVSSGLVYNMLADTTLLAKFAPVFDKRVWEHAVVLLIGAILAPGKRTVTAALRIMGLSDEKHFINYHRVLSRATWSGLALSRILFGLLVALLLSANAPILVVIDDTLERRRGAKIKAKGVFRDAVRSSEKHLVTCFGLRWVCMMVLVPLPWATRPWALPFLTVLAPSERTQTKQGKRHKCQGSPHREHFLVFV